MSHTPHELADDFPDRVAEIHGLKVSDEHFAKLADAYHKVNRAVHRAEIGVDALSEQAEQQIRRERMKLKDEIARILAKT